MSAVSKLSTSSVCEFGLMQRQPLSTRAKPVNSERMSVPAGRPRRWRASTNSSGDTLMASRRAVMASTD
eukprot:scaffold74134_cov95-Phaeocystis_antarctica.AAC.1